MLKRFYLPACFFIFGFTGSAAHAQWSPIGSLLDVPVTQNCSITGGNIALARTDGMFLCSRRSELVNAQVPDASHFYMVHEYGLLAIHTNSHRLADCWAAHQLKTAHNGTYYVKQWITHWKNYGTALANFGTPEQRISNVRACCGCGV